jgi:precorrin-3B synthase
MNLPLRRGACPSLSDPMLTGDGLLVRLKPAGGTLTSRQLKGVAEAAGRYGNGALEITGRGSLQIRGLTPRSALDLRNALALLDIGASDEPVVGVGPLAGLDAAELADPRPLAEDVRRRVRTLGLAARLGPKISVIVDGGGALPMSAIAADVRVEATGGGAHAPWRVAVGGDTASAHEVARCGQMEAAVLAASILRCIADKGREARGRDLDPGDFARLGLVPVDPEHAPQTAPVHPIGRFPLKDGTFAQGFGLAFGQVTADSLGNFVDAAGRSCRFSLCHGRGMLALGLTERQSDALAAIARDIGFVIDMNDPRLGIVACAGAPACASGHLATKALAAAIATAVPPFPAGPTRLHLSGCAKRCAQPPGPVVSLVGNSEGFDLTLEGGATLSGLMRAFLAAIAPERYLVAATGGRA